MRYENLSHITIWFENSYIMNSDSYIMDIELKNGERMTSDCWDYLKSLNAEFQCTNI